MNFVKKFILCSIFFSFYSNGLLACESVNADETDYLVENDSLAGSVRDLPIDQEERSSSFVHDPYKYSKTMNLESEDMNLESKNYHYWVENNCYYSIDNFGNKYWWNGAQWIFLQDEQSNSAELQSESDWYVAACQTHPELSNLKGQVERINAWLVARNLRIEAGIEKAPRRFLNAPK